MPHWLDAGGAFLCKAEYCKQKEISVKVNILGTNYTIKTKTDEEIAKIMGGSPGEYGGYCQEYTKEIVVSKMNNESAYEKVTPEEKEAIRRETLRHEIIHAFLNESGLSSSSAGTACWAKNEEMVDWIAIQFPKLLKVFETADAL